MRPLRVAVIGTGHLGKAHARILSEQEDVELVGIVDPDTNARQAVAAAHGTQAFADHREVIGLIDGAVIAAPTKYHHSIGLDLLSAGVHTLIEKPLAQTAAEGEELMAAAGAHHVLLQVGHIERFNPAFEPVRAEIHDPKYIDAARYGTFTTRSTDIGVVLDLMIHDIDLVLSLVHSPLRQIEAIGISVFGGQEDAATAWLAFENGCVATLTASRTSYTGGRTMQLWSENCYAAVDFQTRTTNLIRPSAQLRLRGLNVEALSHAEKQHLREHLFEEYLPREEIVAEPCDMLTLELRDFIDSVRRSRPPRVTGSQGVQALSVAEAILTCIREHRWGADPYAPQGPLAIPTTPPLTGPHWQRRPAATPARKAG